MGGDAKQENHLRAQNMVRKSLVVPVAVETHDNLCDLTIKNDTGQHSQFDVYFLK